MFTGKKSLIIYGKYLFIQSERLYAHPFEEVVIVIDQPESIELLEIGTATTTTTN